MRRRVETNHGGLWFVSAREQNLCRLRHERHQRELRGCGGVRLRIEEHSFNVCVPCDDVVIEQRRIEHRHPARKRLQQREWIGEEHWRQRVEIRMNGAPGLPDDRHRLFQSALT